ncbi:iduronate-2-sulfatase : Iduronate-2-sulfatase OS=Planctomyces brasiliensis (strain ATCC 49424 / DSM 5305 / JCM 21570 / NBRC 103401 / IFAM 1448) GN=Plabr_3983 PE=4 SV=1: Sulfatase [Gemmataceae bacterium]|nr:iduronate-2-sulfatase : Iduronate-2-sulfatase OS=Planctomyces brasiliensis (strain ATCC 49424 / DSM 5305 / JCM 21570 / NBRC 103401 / IFAM 1448) GN=Plabr_3983 PE=4 SV=1: Sulfatase [Gemmataceae bacterium]VTU02505.1 iduronate-2-sulfatase : Iduronate-2-sulfatase OS=Planctomyces brasiliensis (strain ATCC 49424 / DSM 5305 / JCM 21570 / NBRC 103401 / IFAM 1448) GN=Plabr_3983 PE=4 SV=1: Sulfatase [Gemmataceae bacterium]
MLFIAVDDLNDWVGCMKGHPQAHTPNIDRLAKRGVLFTNAHCAAPLCLPSRTAVLCGQHPERTGVYSTWGETRGKTPPREGQLPVRLAAAGYETLGTGKVYHGSADGLFDRYYETEQRWSPFAPNQVKYTEAELPSKAGPAPRHMVRAGPGGRDWVLPLNGLPSERNLRSAEGESFDWGALDVKDEEMGDARIATWAVARIKEPRPKPFFLAVGFHRPHIPLFAPKRDFDAVPALDDIKLPTVLENDLEDLGASGRGLARAPLTAGTHAQVIKHQQWKHAVRAYLACVAFADRQIGLLLEALDSSPHADNTWIVLWSDHGWALGEKEHWGKWAGWRTVTRVPLIVVPPAGRKIETRGHTCGAPVSLIDLYPTILDMCQLPRPNGLDGVSLLGLVNEPGQSSNRAVVTTFDPGNYALSTESWRYIRYKNGEEELYNIDKDEREWCNLSKDASARTRLQDLRKVLDRELDQRKVTK